MGGGASGARSGCMLWGTHPRSCSAMASPTPHYGGMVPAPLHCVRQLARRYSRAGSLRAGFSSKPNRGLTETVVSWSSWTPSPSLGAPTSAGVDRLCLSLGTSTGVGAADGAVVMWYDTNRVLHPPRASTLDPARAVVEARAGDGAAAETVGPASAPRHSRWLLRNAGRGRAARSTLGVYRFFADEAHPSSLADGGPGGGEPVVTAADAHLRALMAGPGCTLDPAAAALVLGVATTTPVTVVFV